MATGPGAERVAFVGVTIREAIATLDAVAGSVDQSDPEEITAVALRAAIARDNLISSLRVCVDEPIE